MQSGSSSDQPRDDPASNPFAGPDPRDPTAAPDAARQPKPAATALPMTPVQPGERLLSLDVLRGIALFGILVVNIQLFGLPLMQAVLPLEYPDLPLSDQLSYLATRTFFEMKFISLFSLLFGAGLAIQAHRAGERNVAFGWLYARRLVILLAIGLIHALVLWYGDILVFYACFGFILLAMHTVKPKTLAIVGVILLGVSVFMSLTCSGIQTLSMQYQPEFSPLPADPPLGFAAMNEAQFQPQHPVWIHAETVAYQRGPLPDQFLFRVVTWMFTIMAMLQYGWRVLGMFMLGAALCRMGFFRPDARPLQKRLALLGLGAGLTLELVSLALFVPYLTGTGPAWLSIIAQPIHDAGASLLCLGLAGAVCLLVYGRAAGLLKPFAPVGRVALSVYIGQTVIATTIMYSWGFGQFGTFSRAELLGMAVAIYVSLAVLATLWLLLFRAGPLEWLWRTLTYLRPQPLLRRPKESIL